MRKKLIALFLFVLAGMAACSGGDECSTDEDCAADQVCYLYMGTHYCVSANPE